ncbi:MAG: hypothetical protein DI551_00145 [Micavibrio aeruginosavorus]|uniref:LamG-like jellyroll fold domain-containing protein n=1 Tax=Micavibrio aeruginosavorus TaxID=349221 RepID=A0A2W5N961_9BACT|nr:MAG: hypothetical protein DI551_00145 [Micavibrio aeruginosavorus]
MDDNGNMTVSTAIDRKKQRGREAGNAILMLFAAVGMAGVITYGLNTILRGPGATSANITRSTIAQNNLVASTRLAIASATTQQTNGGDCDSDGFVEGLPYRDPGSKPVPTGGGLIPYTMGTSVSDPWGTEYGYCVWDPGTVTTIHDSVPANEVPGCADVPADASMNRLTGAPRDDQPAIAVISAGKNGTFETSCNDYVDLDGDGVPDSPMLNKPAGSDDIVLSYTYAEANGIGGGLWKINSADANSAQIDKNIESTSTGGASFDGAVNLTSQGIVLPPEGATGDCDTEAKNGQLRRNTTTTPPTIEMCDFANGNGWVGISGSGEAAPTDFRPELGNCTANRGGPFAAVGNLSPTTGIKDIWTRTGARNQDIYIASASDGIGIYNYDGTNLIEIDTIGGGSAGWSTLSGDDNYVYAGATTSGQRLVALSYNGSDLTQLDNEAFATNVNSVWSDGDYVYAAAAGGGLSAYSFNGTAFTLAGTHAGVNACSSWGDGTTLLLGDCAAAPAALGFNGSAFTVKATAGTNGGGKVTGNQDYYFTTNGSTLYAYGFTGGVLTMIDSEAVAANDIWSDGVNIFVAVNGGGINAYTFDGTTIALQETWSGTTSANAVWGDGNYIYVATENDGFYILSGYECSSPNPPGGYKVPTSTSGGQTLDDPLDDGLVAHWKMDEKTGTTFADSIGSHTATFLSSFEPHWASGPHGNGSLLFDKDDRTAAQATGLLDLSNQGTIAFWLNINSYDTNGVSLFSIGDIVMFSADTTFGLRMGYHHSGGWNQVPTNRELRGTGWHYVVGTFDSTNDRFRVYVDGMMAADVENTADVVWTGAGANTWFGRHGNGSTDWDLDGGIDDVRVYSRALSPAEAVQLSKVSMHEADVRQPIRSSPYIDTARGLLVAGENHTCIVKKEGEPWCWGRDNTGQLGNGSAVSDSVAPYPVAGISTDTYYLSTVASALTPAGWQLLMSPQATGSIVLTAINSYATSTFYAYTEAGSPGRDDGQGARTYTTTLNYTDTATADCVAVNAYAGRVNSGGTLQTEAQLGNTISLVGASQTFTGSVDLGTFASTDRLRLRYAMTNNCNSGSVVITLNTTSTVQTPAANYAGWSNISSYGGHSCGVRGDGNGFCWGSDSSGQLGNNTAISSTQETPSMVVSDGIPWSKIVAGADHSCGVKANGTLWCWGSEAQGQLGNGSTAATQAAPVQIGTATDWTDITAGYQFTCGIRSDGRAYCWGSDTSGKLGNGSSGSVSAPATVNDFGPWVNINAFENHACGIKADGSAWCWGAGAQGQLGNNTTTDAQSPSLVSLPGPWIDIRPGRYHTCGLRAEGDVYCWGQTADGKLGNSGTPSPLTSPLKVGSAGKAVAVAAGNSHSCAMKADNSVLCWGDDTYGQLGNGSVLTADQPAPSRVESIPNYPLWGWNDTFSTIIGPGMNVGIGANYLSPDGSATGFGFTAAGRAAVRESSAPSQLLLETTAATTSSQITFKTTADTTATDITDYVARWKLDESAGTASSDGGSYTGTLNNGTLWAPSDGRIDGAAIFDGVDDNITISSNVALQPADFTLSFWVNPTGTQAAGAKIIAKTYNSNASPIFNSYAASMTGQSGVVNFETGHTGTTDTLASGSRISNDSWTHVIMVYNPTNSLKKIYINGALSNSKTLATAVQYDNTANGSLYFGQNGAASPTQRFKGGLDSVRLYNRAFTDAEARQLYGFESSGFQIPRSFGIDHANSNLEIGRNNTAATNFMNVISSDLAIATDGKMGIGTETPAVAVDVNGAVRFGTDADCAAANTGAVRYNTSVTPPWQYCNGSAWTTLPTATSVIWKKYLGTFEALTNISCSIQPNGELYCWGKAEFGALGNFQSTTNSLNPTLVQTDSTSAGWADWSTVSTGRDYACGVRANGTAWCWGRANNGQLGDDQTSTDRTRPVQVKDTAGTGTWSDWTMVDAGEDHTCGLRRNGRAYCWGIGSFGKLGNGTIWSTYDTPSEVNTDSASPGWSDWVRVSASGTHGCGTRTNGTAWCWGTPFGGALGNNNDFTNQTRPVQVLNSSAGAGWADWTSAIAGNEFSCGLRVDGSAWCWGTGSSGRLGNGGTSNSNVPTQVKDGSGTYWYDWVQISPGYSHACGIRSNGTAWCWGNAANGRLGDGQTTTNRTEPVQVKDDAGTGTWSDWVAISAGSDYTCGTRVNGGMWCWGETNFGKNGDGQDTTDNQLPVRVELP